MSTAEYYVFHNQADAVLAVYKQFTAVVNRELKRNANKSRASEVALSTVFWVVLVIIGSGHFQPLTE
jgi:hypothetical protein